MIEKTIFKQRALAGASYLTNSMNEITQGSYDLFIGSTSWDARCLSITNANNIEISKTILLLFKLHDNQGYRLSHDPKLIEYFTTKSKVINTIEEDSTNVDLLWNKLFTMIIEFYKNTGRPLNLIVDASTLPKYYLCAIIGNCLTLGLTKQLSIIYSEAKYPSPVSSSLQFTGASWKTVCIDGLLGRYSPDKNREFLVSVGFEGSKTFRAVSKLDPDLVSVLLPDPGYEIEYAQRALQENDKLIQKYCIGEKHILSAPAGDAIETWKKVSEANIENTEQNNIYYLCCGTKPQAIGLTLRSVCLGYPAVLYNIPDEHKVVPTISNGNFWRFNIHDTTQIN